jgi:hypothetical protein
VSIGEVAGAAPTGTGIAERRDARHAPRFGKARTGMDSIRTAMFRRTLARSGTHGNTHHGAGDNADGGS